MDLLDKFENRREADKSFNATVAIAAAFLAGFMGIVGTILGAYITTVAQQTRSPNAVTAPVNPGQK